MINVYKSLAIRLDSLPNGFPPTENGAELRLLAKLFTPEEAELASKLRLNLETPEQIVQKFGGDQKKVYKLLKGMSKRGLINAGRTKDGLGFGLMPFVVGIYEMQVGRLDEELAQLFEDYYQQAFVSAVEVQPTFHRVIPVNQTVQMDIEVRPFESAAEIVSNAKAWGVMDCICRNQKKLIGDPCDHPVDVCMTLNNTPGAFDKNSIIRAISLEEALATLDRAAAAGLVHSVSNTQEGVWYICNCCTCSCGILRGMAELGISNVVARSAFINEVDDGICLACGDCLDYCQFSALSLDHIAIVNASRCVGCGVCVPNCPEDALYLVRRTEAEYNPPPVTHSDWLEERAISRGIDLRTVK